MKEFKRPTLFRSFSDNYDTGTYVMVEEAGGVLVSRQAIAVAIQNWKGRKPVE